MRAGGRHGFTLIELLIVVVIIGILAAIAIPKFASTKEKAYIAAMKSDLHSLATAQEVYSVDQRPNAYAPDLASLAGYFTPTTGVSLNITFSGPSGWSAVATHAAIPAPYSCAYFYGNAAPVAPAVNAGEVRCG